MFNLQGIYVKWKKVIWKIWDDICISDLISEDWGKSDEIKSVETLFQGLLSKAMVEGLSSLGVKKNIGLALLSNYGGDIGFVVMIFFGVHKATFEYSHIYETYLAMINSVPEDVLKSLKKLHGIDIPRSDTSAYDGIVVLVLDVIFTIFSSVNSKLSELLNIP